MLSILLAKRMNQHIEGKIHHNKLWLNLGMQKWNNISESLSKYDTNPAIKR